MGRYGRHNRPNNNHKKSFRVTEDFDSSEEQEEQFVKQDFDSANEERKSVVRNLKNRIREYRSPEAKAMRREKKLEKRDREIEDLTYKAKREKLKGVIRKSQNTSPRGYGMGKGYGYNSNVMPKQNYDGMDRMLGLGSSNQKRSSKKPDNRWGGMDRMLGFGN